MSLLVLGGRGYICEAFERELFKRNVPHITLSRFDVDYTNFSKLLGVIRSFKPELIINTAALVCKPSVDFNEDQKEATIMANTVFVETLCNACELTHTPLMQVSSGCLYNETGNGHAFTESDEPMLTMNKGAGIYVSSKVMAENIVRRYPDHYISRIRLPFDEYDNPRNYITKLLTYPKVFNAVNSISHRGDFVNACLDMWEKRIPWGTYNCTNTGATDAIIICGLLAAQGLKKEFVFWDNEEFLSTVAKTLKSNATLDNSKLTGYGIAMRHVDDAIAHSIANWKTL